MSLVENIKKGDKYKIFYNRNNPNNRTIHILVVLPEEEIMLYKVWFKHKQYWSYQTESFYGFELLEREGYLTKVI